MTKAEKKALQSSLCKDKVRPGNCIHCNYYFNSFSWQGHSGKRPHKCKFDLNLAQVQVPRKLRSVDTDAAVDDDGIVDEDNQVKKRV